MKRIAVDERRGGGGGGGMSARSIGRCWECPQCGKTMNWYNRSHHKAFHDGRTTCTTCGRVFTRINQLRVHRQRDPCGLLPSQGPGLAELPADLTSRLGPAAGLDPAPSAVTGGPQREPPPPTEADQFADVKPVVDEDHTVAPADPRQ
ncbi:hypothetical protein FJT64_007788 [Amphibalanus amphitrite]|uniref:C2H2-type domain-containing protein n=1 Tax=Amphibalanus amphitrite TaxID=1232801 RepID=A0A6A4VUS2_AMPAM|nr:hypothetical protein FJT64_007788 [Amphibalanus amphitrite]